MSQNLPFASKSKKLYYFYPQSYQCFPEQINDLRVQTKQIHLLAQMSRRLINELIVCMPPSYVVHRHVQISSPLKPLGQVKPNFILSLHGLGERKFVQMVMFTSYRQTLTKRLFWSRVADVIETCYTALGTPTLPSVFR